MNRWVYCLNDPINRMDKYGTWSWDISLDRVIDFGGALFDSAVNLVGDAVEFVVDTVVEVVETAIEVVDAAIDVAEQFVTNAIRAADAVCSAVVAGCTAIKLAWDNLDPGLKQWIVMGLSIAVSFMPVVGPIISCIIDGSFVDIYNAVRSGDWGMLALSLTAFIPGGKALKGLKGLSAIGDISKAAKAESLGKLALKKGQLTFKFSGDSAKHAAKHFDDIARKGRTGSVDDTISFIEREWSSAKVVGPGSNSKYKELASGKLMFIVEQDKSTIVTIHPY